MDEQKLEQLTGEFCDKYCQYPNVCADQGTLDKVCEKCPMKELSELLDDNDTTGAVKASPEIKTNYDRIRNMSVEEFVEEVFLNVDVERNMMYVFGSWRNKDKLKQWLESECDTE